MLFSNDDLNRLRSDLGSAQNMAELNQRIVDGPFTSKMLATTLDLGIVVFLQVDGAKKTIQRIALSNTEQAKGARSVSAIPFHDIVIPLDDEENIIATAITTGKYTLTEDWQYLFTPALTPDEARRNQAAASIECSIAWPLSSGDGGALIFSFFQPPEFISDEHLEFIQAYAQLVDEVLGSSVSLK